MSVSTRKIQELLASHFDSNGWAWSSTWKSDSHPSVLTEVWTVCSKWSPADVIVYIGFENWDESESVGFSTEPPVGGEKNEWVDRVSLLKGWQAGLEALLESIERLRG